MDAGTWSCDPFASGRKAMTASHAYLDVFSNLGRTETNDEFADEFSLVEKSFKM